MAVYIGLYKIFQKNEDALGVPEKEAVSFGNRFCKAQQGMYCDRTKLLNAFREYYLCLYGTNISTSNNTPAKLTQLISTTLKIPVQRVRKNRNRLAFDGLCFDEKTFKTFISVHTQKISEEEFDNYIDNMSKQIKFLK